MDDINATEFVNNDTHQYLIDTLASHAIISDEVLYYFLFVNFWGPGLGVCILGVVTNILNIITFVKQGVRDTVNISLLGLATSDLGSQITLLYTNITFLPSFIALDLPFVRNDIMYVISWCHIMFTRISTWITAYITLERCLCVTAPLKVKSLFTSKRTVWYLIFVYVFMLASVSPCFYTARPARIFDNLNNRTLIGIFFLEDRNTIETIAFITNNTLPTVAFCLVTICTVILVTNLRRKSQWRRQATMSTTTVAVTDRDNKVVKMVVLISAIFIICYFPGAAAFIYMLFDQEMRFDGLHKNLLFSVFSVLFHLESINAGVNIFIYLCMSSKFKTTFMNIFRLKNNKASTSQK